MAKIRIYQALYYDDKQEKYFMELDEGSFSEIRDSGLLLQAYGIEISLSSKRKK